MSKCFQGTMKDERKNHLTKKKDVGILTKKVTILQSYKHNLKINIYEISERSRWK